MNKIYKVVWSKVKHCYVVTSELAKRQTKGCGARSLRMATVSLGVAASLLCSGAVLPIFVESVAEAAVTVSDASDPENKVTPAGGIGHYDHGSTLLGFNVYTIQAAVTTDKELSITGSSNSSVSAQNGFVGCFDLLNNVTGSGASLSNGTVGVLIGGGTYSGSNVTNNTVKVTGGTVDIGMYGGFSYSGKATGNSIEISGDSTVINSNPVGSNDDYSKVVGGSGKTGTSKNTVTIKGGKINSYVYGGYSEDGVAGGSTADEGNTVNIAGGTVTGTVYGGYTFSSTGSTGAVKNNKVIITGVSTASDLYIYGGYTYSQGDYQAGEVTGNTVEISNGKIKGVYGGYVSVGKEQYSAKADNNTVSISGDAELTSRITGGSSVTIATNNHVNLSGQSKVGGAVYGGYTSTPYTDYESGATGNDVTISENAELGNSVIGGCSQVGKAESNVITIKGGTVKEDSSSLNPFIAMIGNGVYGGFSLGSGNVLKNTVTIEGGTVSAYRGVYGGWAKKGTAGGSSADDGNKVSITGGTVSKFVYGGYSDSGNAKFNTVTVSSEAAVFGVVGGSSKTGAVTDNKVTITGGTINNDVYGGSSKSGAVTGNPVSISGGTVTGDVYGGYSATGNSTKNSVIISGGTFNGQGNDPDQLIKKQAIFGGYNHDQGSASENTVTISGGTFIGSNGILIQGGRTYYATGTTNNNIVNLTGTVTGLENGSLLGGGSSASNTGNELHVGGTKDGTITGVWQGKTGDTVNNKVNSVANFDKVVLHSVKWDKDVAALEATTVNNVKTLDITDLKFYTDAAGTTQKTSFEEGESMALLKSGSDISSIKLTYKGGTNETISPEGIIVKGGSGEQTEATGVNGVKLTTKGGSEKVSLPDVNTIMYSFEAGKVNKITFGTFDSGKEARDLSGSKFEEGNTIDALDLSFADTASLLKKNDAITLINKATGMVTSVTNGTGKTIGSNFTDDNKIQFTTEAKGDVTSTGTEVKYTVTDVTLKKVDLTNWNGTTSDMSSQTAGWTLKAGETVATGDLAKADLSDLKPGDTKTILTAGDSVKFTNDAIAGNKKWQAGGEIIDTAVNGVKIEGTTTGGGVKVDDNKSNQLVYQQSKDNVTKVTLSEVPYTKDGTARAFGNAYDLTNAGIDATAFKLSNLDDVKASMKTGDTMVVVDAVNAIKVAGEATRTLKDFTTINAGKAIDFADAIDGKALTLSGTHQDTLEQNGDKNQILYKVGEKNVTAATFTGEVAWNDSEAYYTNDTSKYKIAATNVDATALKVTGTSTTALKKGDAMTLISAEGMTATLAKDQSEANKAASKITVNYSDIASGIAFGAEATGGVKTATNAVNYEVTGVTLKSVDLGGWSGTTGDLTAGDTSSWTAEDKSVAVNNADAISVTPKETQAIVIAGSGMFANVKVVKETAFDPVTQNGVTLTGTQTNTIKTAKTAVDNDTILYEIGKKDVKKINIGEVAWGGAALDGGKDYNYTNAAVNTEGFDVTYAKPEEVAANQSMTLLQANETLKAIVNEEKAKTYSIEPVAGVTIEAKLTGKLANSGNNVTFTATENKASALTFGKVEWTGDTPLLDHSKTLKNVSFNGATVDTSNIDFYKEMYIEADQTTTLVSGFGGNPKDIKGTTYKVGTAFDGEGSATMENGNLVFRTKTSAGVSEQTHKAVMGVEATMGLLANGIGHLDKVLDGFGNVSNAGSDGASTSASIGGGKDRYETGSHVNINSWSAAVGVGARKETKKGTLQYGIFGEYGKGSYTMHSDVGRSDGDAHYAGGGLMAKWTNKHDVYTEASFRLGRVSDTANDLLRDGAGNAYGYDIHATYYGAHIGLGKVFNYKGGKSLDVYGKFFYTKRDGCEFDAKQHYNLDSVNSSVLRIGARYGTTDKKWNWYGGLAYEYEFDGEAKGTVNGTEIRAASIKGSSVRGEFGMRMDATKDNPWRTDISIYGYGGKHRGFGGSVNVAYTF